jgi:hypothetical protein
MLSMATPSGLSWATIRRCVTGRRARRLCVALFLVVVAFSGVLRVRSFLLTRKIQAVVSGLQQLRVDVSKDAEIQSVIPSMVAVNQAPTEEEGMWRSYGLKLSNDDDWYRIASFEIYWPIDPHSREPRTSKWQSLSLPLWVAYVLGWRHISFEANVTVVNGVVSGVQYDIDPDVLVGFPSVYMVVVRSAHGLWFSRVPAPVGDVDDEAPDYRFGRGTGPLTSQLGPGGSIGLAYTADAPTDLVSHAYDLSLSCFWSLFGCRSARQVLPRLWEDREAVIRAAASRLASPEPCPDRILAGRVRRLLDLVVERREVTDPGLAGATSPAADAAEARPGYRVEETIRGDPKWFPTLHGWTPEMYPSGFLWRRDPVTPSLKAGDEVLVFLGADFQSCRIVPATASAEAAVRTAVPAPRHREDNILDGRQ